MTLSCSLTSRTICLLVSSPLGWPRARPLDAHFSLMARTSSFAASSSPSVGRLAAHYSGRPVALPFVAVVHRRHIRVFFDIVLTVFATVGRLLCLAGSGRCPSTRSCSPVSRTSIFSTSSSPSLRRLATHHVGPARCVALRRAVVHWLHGRATLRYRPHCLCDGWPPTMLGRLGAWPHGA